MSDNTLSDDEMDQAIKQMQEAREKRQEEIEALKESLR